MGKVIVFLILAAGIALLVPESREFILSKTPLGNSDPMQATEKKLEMIQNDLQETANTDGLYPQPDVFHEWCLQTYRVQPRDAWGSPFYYDIHSSSITVGSAGPDQLPGTTDDVISVRQRG